MPSPHQHAADRREFESEAEKLVATKDRPTLEALIRGMDDPERVDAFAMAEFELAEADDRSPRKPLIGRLQRRLDALQND